LVEPMPSEIESPITATVAAPFAASTSTPAMNGRL